MPNRPSLPRASSAITSPIAITRGFCSAMRCPALLGTRLSLCQATMAARRPLGNVISPALSGFPRNMNGLGVLEYSDMLHYNICMSEHHHHGHHHHHHEGHAHPSATVHASILRMS